jgi:hypothetical protein
MPLRWQNDLEYMDDNAEKLGRQKMRSDAMKRQFAIHGMLNLPLRSRRDLNLKRRLQTYAEGIGVMSILLWRRRFPAKGSARCLGYKSVSLLHATRGTGSWALLHCANTTSSDHARG